MDQRWGRNQNQNENQKQQKPQKNVKVRKTSSDSGNPESVTSIEDERLPESEDHLEEFRPKKNKQKSKHNLRGQGSPNKDSPVVIKISSKEQLQLDDDDEFDNISPGIEGLHGINSIFVQRMSDEIEDPTVIKSLDRTNNCYTIFGQAGKLGADKPTFRHFKKSQRILSAGEVSNCCARLCLGHNRPFSMMIFDGFGQIVIIIERKCTFFLCLFGGQCGGGSMTVKLAMTNRTLGTVIKNCGIDAPTYSILDRNGSEMMQVLGPSCSACCCTTCAMKGNALFKILRVGNKNFQRDPNVFDGQLIGYIQNHFDTQDLDGGAKDGFGLQLQSTVDAETKAVLLAALFAIDYSFYESGNVCSRGKICTGLNAVVTALSFLILFLILYFVIKANN